MFKLIVEKEKELPFLKVIKTRVYLCSTHFLKMIVTKARKIESNNRITKIFKTFIQNKRYNTKKLNEKKRNVVCRKERQKTNKKGFYFKKMMNFGENSSIEHLKSDLKY